MSNGQLGWTESVALSVDVAILHRSEEIEMHFLGAHIVLNNQVVIVYLQKDMMELLTHLFDDVVAIVIDVLSGF